MGRLDGKVALISGGARGQGATEARLFASEGARVVLGDLLDREGKAVEEEIRGSGGEATYVHLDVTKSADWAGAIQAALSSYGELTVLVNNAGIFIRKRLLDTSEEDWDRIMAVNAKGVFLGTKHVVPSMQRAGGGSIINIGSTSGFVGSAFGTSAYAATKGAVRLLTKSTAMEYARDKIRCNCVFPAPIETPMIQDMLDDPAMRQGMLERVPIGRIGATEDIAYGVLYLASNESSFVTGADLAIDGGFTAQ